MTLNVSLWLMSKASDPSAALKNQLTFSDSSSTLSLLWAVMRTMSSNKNMGFTAPTAPLCLKALFMFFFAWKDLHGLCAWTPKPQFNYNPMQEVSSGHTGWRWDLLPLASRAPSPHIRLNIYLEGPCHFVSVINHIAGSLRENLL